MSSNAPTVAPEESGDKVTAVTSPQSKKDSVCRSARYTQVERNMKGRPF